jgi:hypothetical protein
MLQKKLNLNLASLVTMNFGTESDAGAAEQELLLAIRSKITTKSRAKAIFVVAPSEQAPSKKIINLTGGGRISIFYEPWLSVSEAKLLFDRREIHAYAPAYKVRDRSGFSHRRQEQFLSSYLWSKVTHPVSSEPVPPIILDKLFPWVEANCPDFRGLERPGYSSERGQLGILVNYYDQVSLCVCVCVFGSFCVCCFFLTPGFSCPFAGRLHLRTQR